MRYTSFYLLLLISFFAFSGTLHAQVEVELSPITFTTEDSEERMNQIYAACDGNLISLDSTVQFVLDGCEAPVLVSMDAMRSSSNPFDPNEVGKDEIFVKGPPYLVDFEEEGMYVIFCDATFKSVATCITMVENLEELSPVSPPSESIPTLGEWGLIMLSLSLCIVGLVYTQQEYYMSQNAQNAQ